MYRGVKELWRGCGGSKKQKEHVMIKKKKREGLLYSLIYLSYMVLLPFLSFTNASLSLL